ncbi:hypothetical protein JCM30237_23290 [Halolamina litorea]
MARAGEHVGVLQRAGSHFEAYLVGTRLGPWDVADFQYVLGRATIDYVYGSHAQQEQFHPHSSVPGSGGRR